MNIYLVTCEGGLTDNYHSGGAMLVAAESETDALEVFHEHRSKSDSENDLRRANEATVKQIVVNGRGKLATIPDAGCC